jgi:hypothetical protein
LTEVVEHGGNFPAIESSPVTDAETEIGSAMVHGRFGELEMTFDVFSPSLCILDEGSWAGLREKQIYKGCVYHVIG